MNRARRGFTLVELLVVITIIAMLAALILPAVQMAREAARRATCINNQKQIALAVQNYESGKQKLPPSYAPHSTTGTNYVGWVHALLPFLERTDLAELYASNNLDTAQLKLNFLICPSGQPSQASGPNNYVVNCGRKDGLATGAAGPMTTPTDWQENGVFFTSFTTIGVKTPVPVVSQSMSYISRGDGTKNTLMLSENQNTLSSVNTVPVYRTGISWNNPGVIATAWTTALSPEWEMGLVWFPITTADGINKNVEPIGAAAKADNAFARPSSGHPGLAVAGFCDGGVRTLSDEVDYRVYALIMTAKGTKAKEPLTGATPAAPYPTWVGTPLSDSDLEK